MKKQLLLFVMMLLPMVAMADAVEIDGIYYNLITKVGIAEVTYGNWTPLFDHDGDGRYSGIINIPESVTYEDVNYSVTSIGAKAFMHCKGLTSVTIPNSVTSIGEEAFQNCKGLTSITIPKSITKIENNGFWLCSSLTSVNISDIAAWCNISFSSETSNPLYEAQRLYLNGEEVTDLTIPNNVTSISNNAFINCKSLSSVTFHGDLKSIGENAFSGCANIPSVIIPNSVTDMGISAFENCIGLTSVKIGNGINYLSQYDFAGCTSIKHLIIDCKEISEFCFINFTSVEDITLGDRVEKIGSKAFSGCIGITTVNFGANIKTVEEDAFKGIPNNSKINISDIKGWCQIDFSNSTANPLFYTKKIFLNDEEIKNLIIPEGISSIGKNAFIRCEGLTSITLPQSVKTIGEDAFKECEGLLTIHISDLRMWFSYKFNITSNPLYYARHLYLNGEEIKELIVPDDITSINDYLFYKCLSITSLTIGTNVASIGECAFARCENLNSVTLSEGLKSIGRSTFSGCKDLSNIDLPNSLYSLGMSAFEGCSNLSSIIIPNKITKIEAATFYKCIELVSVAMGNGVRDIRYEAFSNCSRLASVSIGSGITKIEHNAFENCPELNNFYCYAENVPTTGKDVFKGSYIEYATLYVPASSISLYQTAEPWSSFGTIKVIEYESPGNENGDGYWSTYYNSMGNFEADDNTKVYTASLDELQEKLVLTEVTDKIIKAGQGVILKSTSANANLAYTSAEGTEGFYTNNALKGFDEATTTTAVEGTIYVLGENSSKELGFYKYSGTTLNAHKAYLEINASSARQFYSIDDNTTDISKIMNTPRVTENVFNLQGQQVAHPSKGAYIVNGHKVIIK